MHLLCTVVLFCLSDTSISCCQEHWCKEHVCVCVSGSKWATAEKQVGSKSLNFPSKAMTTLPLSICLVWGPDFQPVCSRSVFPCFFLPPRSEKKNQLCCLCPLVLFLLSLFSACCIVPVTLSFPIHAVFLALSQEIRSVNIHASLSLSSALMFTWNSKAVGRTWWCQL